MLMLGIRFLILRAMVRLAIRVALRGFRSVRPRWSRRRRSFRQQRAADQMAQRLRDAARGDRMMQAQRRYSMHHENLQGMWRGDRVIDAYLRHQRSSGIVKRILQVRSEMEAVRAGRMSYYDAPHVVQARASRAEILRSFSDRTSWRRDWERRQRRIESKERSLQRDMDRELNHAERWPASPAIEAIGQNAYDLCMEMTGNKGQKSIIRNEGVRVWINFAQDVYNDEGDPEELMEWFSHPEAVIIILGTGTAYVIQAVNQLKSLDEGFVAALSGEPNYSGEEGEALAEAEELSFYPVSAGGTGTEL